MEGVPGSPSPAAAALRAYHAEHVMACTACPLHATRTTVVAGSGSPDAPIMFVGEAPGYHEDRSGVPFVGQAGQLLDQLLEGIGLSRDAVFVANVLKCRPPGNRDPQPAEIAACERHLFRQVAIIRPALVCTLGNFATKLLSGRPDGISRVHGCELDIEVAGQPTVLYPLFHPAAALYTRSMLTTLQEDFARIPALIGRAGALRAAGPAPVVPDVVAPPAPTPASVAAAPPPAEQLGLF